MPQQQLKQAVLKLQQLKNKTKFFINIEIPGSVKDLPGPGIFVSGGFVF